MLEQLTSDCKAFISRHKVLSGVAALFTIHQLVTGFYAFTNDALSTASSGVGYVAKYIELDRNRATNEAERELNKELQTELAALGCYTGPVDGTWGEQSKSALTDFLYAVGVEEKHPNSVKIADLRQLLSSATDGACRNDNPVNRGFAKQRYVILDDKYKLKCTRQELFGTAEDSSVECQELKAERDALATRLTLIGVPF